MKTKITGAAAAFFLAGAALAAGPASFADVAGWSYLTWGMTLPAARAAFEKNGVPYKEKYMAKDGATFVTFVRDAAEGTAYFDARRRLTQILFQSPYLATEEEAEAAAAAVAVAYGAAPETRTISYQDGLRQDRFYIWRNEATVLTVTLAHYLKDAKWVVWENYVPVVMPGTAEGIGAGHPGEEMNAPPKYGHT